MEMCVKMFRVREKKKKLMHCKLASVTNGKTGCSLCYTCVPLSHLST